MKTLRSHGWVSWTLIVIGTVLTIVAIMSTWLQRQVLSTDVWVDTSSALISQPAIQEATAAYLSQQITASPVVKERVGQALPPALQRLAGPITGLLGQASERIALQAMRSGKFNQAWIDANRVAHSQLVSVIKGNNKNLSIQGDTVFLDLRPMLKQLAARIGIPTDVVNKLPASIATIKVLQKKQISTIQKIANALDGLQWWSLIFVVLFFGAGVLFAGDRRAALVKVSGGLLVASLLILLLRRVGGTEIVKALTNNGPGAPAADAVWTIATSLLRSIALGVFLFGLLLLSGSWLVGPGKRATKVRNAITPVMRDHPVIPMVIVVSVMLFLSVMGFLPWGTRPLALLIYLGSGVLFVLTLRRMAPEVDKR